MSLSLAILLIAEAPDPGSWLKISQAADGSFSEFLDFSSIQRSGDQVSAQTMTVYADKRRPKAVHLIIHDCQSRLDALKAVTLYAPDGSSKSHVYENVKWTTVPAGSVGEERFHLVCRAK